MYDHNIDWLMIMEMDGPKSYPIFTEHIQNDQEGINFHATSTLIFSSPIAYDGRNPWALRRNIAPMRKSPGIEEREERSSRM
jgi:hypothetical protein